MILALSGQVHCRVLHRRPEVRLSQSLGFSLFDTVTMLNVTVPFCCWEQEIVLVVVANESAITDKGSVLCMDFATAMALFSP